MENSNLKVSIVIRCFNEEQHIGRLLSGLLMQTIKNIEIIIVDSGSTDATCSIAAQFPVQILKIDPATFSFGRALNIGCKVATGELIVIASAHVYPIYQEWLEQLLAPFCNPDVALTYGKQRGCDLTKYSEHQIFATWFPDKLETKKSQNYPFCNNANAAIRRDLWEQYPYDENLTGLEDIDWAKRIMETGHKIVYVPDALIIHVHQETPTRIYNRYRRESIALKKIYPQENFNLLDFVRLTTSNIFSDYFHALHEKCFWRNLLQIPIFRLMQFWGTFRGFSQVSSVNRQLRYTFYYPRILSRPKVVNNTKYYTPIDYTKKLVS
jgi:rhamnosyltransferase